MWQNWDVNYSHLFTGPNFIFIPCVETEIPGGLYTPTPVPLNEPCMLKKTLPMDG